MRFASWSRAALTAAVTLPAYEQIGEARRWSILGAGTLAQAASAVTVNGPAFLIPALHEARGVPLATAGLVASAPLAGIMLALFAWGVAVDRFGERAAMLSGQALALLGCGAAVAAASLTDALAPLAAGLFLAGAGTAATHSASGRVVVGWFPPHRRGLAMGIRQMAAPVGVGIAAATMAVLADRVGLAAALWVPTLATALSVVVVALVVADPPRPPRTVATAANPYAADSYLARVHLVSVLLVVPQFLVWTYALTWLVTDLGWSAGAAGGLVALTQLLGGAARVGAGWVSDAVGSRMRPLLWVTVAVTVTMTLLGATAALAEAPAVLVLVLASVVTVSPNGLAFTGVAERAGPFWAGRALGVQNSAQNLVASAVPPLAGLAIAAWGYPATFALAAVFPLLAIALVPVRRERAAD